MSRRVFITGGSAGLGRALVDHYADAGWSVVTQGRRAADQIAPPLPQHVTYQQHDFARDVGLPAMVTDAPLDLAILNAGAGHVGPLTALTDDQIAELVHVNTTAPLLQAQALYPTLAAAKGTLVLIGSTTARGAHPDFASYAATKAALAGAARALRLEWQDRVRVVIVHPGPTATEMHDRAGLPQSGIRRLFTPAPIVARAVASAAASGRDRRLGMTFLLRHAPAALRASGANA